MLAINFLLNPVLAAKNITVILRRFLESGNINDKVLLIVNAVFEGIYIYWLIYVVRMGAYINETSEQWAVVLMWICGAMLAFISIYFVVNIVCIRKRRRERMTAEVGKDVEAG